MKTTAFKLIIFIISLSFFKVSAQEQTIQLKMKEGYEYNFELVDTTHNYFKAHNRKLRFTVEKVIPNEEIILWATITENKAYHSFFVGHLVEQDYFFLDLFSVSSQEIRELYSSADYHFSLNLKKGKVELLNRVEILEEIHKLIEEKGINKKSREEYLRVLNENGFKEQIQLVDFLLWFQNKKIVETSNVKSDFHGDKSFSMVVNGTNAIYSYTGKDSESINYTFDIQKGLPESFVIEQSDTVRRSHQQPPSIVVNKKQMNFTSCNPVSKQLYISGTIENPLSDWITIAFLNKPFGFNAYSKALIIDENGKFETTINYDREGFVYLINENKNRNEESAQIVFYATPGDSLIFNASGSEAPWELNFYGNRNKEAEIINQIISKTALFNLKLIDGLKVPFNNIYFYKSEDYKNIEALLEEIERLMPEYKTEISKQSFKFIQDELKASCYAGIYQYLKMLNRFPSTVLIYPIDTSYKARFEKLIEGYDVNEHYNDYGANSRFLIDSYLSYYLLKAQNVDQNISTAILSGGSSENMVGFAPILSYGSRLYREIAFLLSGMLSGRAMGEYFNFSPEDKFALQHLEQLKNRCNDREFLLEVERILTKHNQWQNESHVPEITFLNQEKKKVRFSDYFGEKPTIFFITNNWSVERYSFDDHSKEVSEVNFVMVMEGSNFEIWEDYMSRAEPVADQLFLLNDSLSLQDIFLSSNRLYLIYNKTGKYMGYERKIEDAIKTARNSLKETKTDKSTLKLIIVILGIIIIFVVLITLIWRMRMKQRFRKEQQIRKLRELELTAIRAQMNPHFLFNSLNSVQNLIQQNRADEAHLYLSDFAGLIRKVLQNSEKEEVSLATELEMVEQYIRLEQLRFEFHYRINVEEGIDTHNCMIPPVLIQPFVENAINHGLQLKQDQRELLVEVLRSDEFIKVVVEDNGVGLKESEVSGDTKNGKGIKMNRERLKILQEKQGEKYLLKIIDLVEENKKGTRVEIFLPDEH